MSKVFNSSGIGGANCIFLAGVDSDNATVRDFVNLSDALTQDGGGEAPISGVYGYGFIILASGSNTLGYNCSAGPTINAGPSNANTMFIAYNSVTAASAGTVQSIAQNTTTTINAPYVAFKSALGGGLQPALLFGASSGEVDSGVTFTNGTSHTVGVVSTYNGGASASIIYTDGTQAATGSNTGIGANTQTLGRIGTVNGQGTSTNAICYLAYFNIALSAGQISGLHSSLTGNGAFSLINPTSAPNTMGKRVYILP